MSKARILNVYHIKELILRGNPPYENFYKEELIEFCKISKQEIDRLNNIINELENTIANFIENHTESYIDWKYDREIYLAECNILQKLCDTYFDKLKELKENNK